MAHEFKEINTYSNKDLIKELFSRFDDCIIMMGRTSFKDKQKRVTYTNYKGSISKGITFCELLKIQLASIYFGRSSDAGEDV